MPKLKDLVEYIDYLKHYHPKAYSIVKASWRSFIATYFVFAALVYLFFNYKIWGLSSWVWFLLIGGLTGVIRFYPFLQLNARYLLGKERKHIAKVIVMHELKMEQWQREKMEVIRRYY